MVIMMKWKSVKERITAMTQSADATLGICGNQILKILETLLQVNVFLYLKNVGMVLKKVMKNVMKVMTTWTQVRVRLNVKLHPAAMVTLNQVITKDVMMEMETM